MRPTGEIVEVNRAFAELVDRDAGALERMPLEALFPRTARVLFYTWLFPILRTNGRAEEVELPMLRGDGEQIDVVLSASFDGSATGLIRIAAMRVRARRWLEDQLLNARRAADQVPGVIFQLLREQPGVYRFTYVSEGAQDVLGCTPADLVADVNAFASIVSAEDLQRLYAAIRRSEESDSSLSVEFVCGVEDIARWVRASALPRRQLDGSVVWSGYAEDVTPQRTIQTLEREREAAERASIAKSAFLASLSHELRNPLNAIVCLSRLLSMRVPAESADERKKLGHIHFAGQTMLRLINEVLDISQIEAGGSTIELVPVALKRVLDASFALVGPLAEDRGIRVETTKDARVWVRTDEGRAIQAITNLLSNAVKYNRVGGAVSVRVTTDERVVRVDVQDEGPGLSDAQIEAIFRPYTRLDPKGRTPGTGLGLHLTRALVERMSGEVHVHSEIGRGSTFSVLLPRAMAPEVDPAPRSITLPSLHILNLETPDRLVLYIEDEPVNVLVMQEILELRPGLRLINAPTVAEGITLALRHQPELILVDMHLPDGTGIDALERLLQAGLPSETHFTAVSAAAMPEDIYRARIAGFHDYWIKPLDIDATLTALDLLYPAPKSL